MKKTFKLVTTSLGLVGLAHVSLLGLSKYAYHKMLKVNDDLKGEDGKKLDGDKQASIHNLLAWLSLQKVEKVFVSSLDGSNLAGKLIKNHQHSNYVIISSGYNISTDMMLNLVRYFDSIGLNVLLPDQRGHGLNKELKTSLGWFEQFDLLKWIDFLRNKDTNSNIALYGLSMGAFSTLLALNNPLEDNVKCAVVEGSYTNLKDMIKIALKKKNKYGDLLMPYIEHFFKHDHGFKLNDVNALKGLKTASVPLLLIHGAKDDIVPLDMGYQIFESYGCKNKEMLVLENGYHTSCFYEDYYFKNIGDFIFKYLDNRL